VWLEFRGFRVVHACWHKRSLDDLRPYLDSQNRFTEKGLREALRRGSTAYRAADILMKGPEQRVPCKTTFFDGSGDERHDVRIRWWDPHATTFRKAAIEMDDRLGDLADLELPTDFRYMESEPVLFGHYSLPGEPAITFSNAACLDFSVARAGYLTAYRWSGECMLSSKHLVYVPANSEDGI
jgi:hypothetical protein